MNLLFDDFIATKEKNTTYSFEKESFSLKCPNDFLTYTKKCYNYLRVLGLCHNSIQFSLDFLHKSKDYYASLKTLGRDPSIATLHTLIKSLEEISNNTNINQTKQNKITDLINAGQQLLFKKYMNDM